MCMYQACTSLKRSKHECSVHETGTPLSHRIDFTALVEKNHPGLQRALPRTILTPFPLYDLSIQRLNHRVRRESERPAPGGAASGKA